MFSILTTLMIGAMLEITQIVIYLKLKRRMIAMANEQETALDDALAGLKTEIANAAQRVIDKIEAIQANNPDLSDELQDVLDDTVALQAIGSDVKHAPVPEPVSETGTAAETQSTSATGPTGEGE